MGAPQVRRAEAIRLGDYCLGLYGARSYLAEHGFPDNIADLARFPLVYFIDSMLQVDELDMAASFAPAMRESVTSTNVFVHVEATAPRPAWACCRVSWPTVTRIWCGFCPQN